MNPVATRFFQELRSQISSDYYLIQWILFIFIGALLNTVFLFQYANFIQSSLSKSGITIIVILIIYSALLVFAPVIVSVILSQLLPYKKIVPPYFVLIVAAGLFFVNHYSTFTTPPNGGVDTLLLMTYVLFSGGIGEAIITFLVGRQVTQEDIITYCFKVRASLEKIRSILLTDKYRNRFGIDAYVIDDEANLLRFRSLKAARNKFLIEVRKLDPSKEPYLVTDDLCEIDIASFREGRYSFDRTVNLEERSRESFFVYLKDVLQRESIDYDFLQDARPDSLLDLIIDSQAGMIVRRGAISRWAWIRAILFISALGVGTYYILLGVNQTATLAGWAIVTGLIGFAIFSGSLRIPRKGRIT
ncbi:MAG: hypothetical protein ACRDF4_06675 [Rhabdochlamydiaceae bacterium]